MTTVPDTMTVPKFVGEGKIDWADVPVPEPGAGQLLIEVRANALCGTDRWQHIFGSPQATPGHEASGVVAAGGERTSTAVGTAGVVYLMDYCGQCRNCRSGNTNQCLDKRGDVGFTRDGGLGRYAVVGEHAFFAVPDDLPLSEATLLLDVMGTSGHAIGRAGLLHQDIQRVVIAGAGPIGLGLCAMVPLLLGDHVEMSVFDPQPERLALAERLGANVVDLDGEGRPLLEQPADVGFDAAGKGAARRSVLGGLDQRGVLVCVGHGEGLDLKVTDDLIATERAVLGSEYFRFGELDQNLALLQQHRDRLFSVITHRFALTSLSEAFDAFLSGETGKVVVEQAPA